MVVALYRSFAGGGCHSVLHAIAPPVAWWEAALDQLACDRLSRAFVVGDGGGYPVAADVLLPTKLFLTLGRCGALFCCMYKKH